MGGREAISITNMQVCPNCKRELHSKIFFNLTAGHFEFWLDCPNCHLYTKPHFIGTRDVEVAYRGDRQSDIEPQPAAPPPDNPPNIPMTFYDWTCECSHMNPGFTVNTMHGEKIKVYRNCQKCKKGTWLESIEKKEN